MRIALLFVIAMFLTLSAGCKKAAENAQQAAVEKAIEQASGGKVSADAKSGSVTITDKETGSQTTVGTGKGSAKMPEGWPKEIPPYPGSSVVAQSSTSSAKGKLFTLVLDCPDSVDKVLAYYDGKLTAAGYKKGVEMKKDDGTTRFYESSKMSSQITVFAENGKTKVSMTLGPK
jgi:hypothetical protein